MKKVIVFKINIIVCSDPNVSKFYYYVHIFTAGNICVGKAQLNAPGYARQNVGGTRRNRK